MTTNIYTQQQFDALCGDKQSRDAFKNLEIYTSLTIKKTISSRIIQTWTIHDDACLTFENIKYASVIHLPKCNNIIIKNCTHLLFVIPHGTNVTCTVCFHVDILMNDDPCSTIANIQMTQCMFCTAQWIGNINLQRCKYMLLFVIPHKCNVKIAHDCKHIERHKVGAKLE